MSSISTVGSRRKAYQCLRCLHRDGKTFIEARYRVYNHFMKKHVSLDEVPFYCKWCHFLSYRKEDLERHITSYARHKSVMEEKGLPDTVEYLVENRGLPDTVEYLVENRSPYKVTERDVAALSTEESAQHWLAVAQKNKKGDYLQQAMESAFMEDFAEPHQAEEQIPVQEDVTAEEVTQNGDWRDITPTVQSVVDVSQYMAPLQQLVNMLAAQVQPTPPPPQPALQFAQVQSTPPPQQTVLPAALSTPPPPKPVVTPAAVQSAPPSARLVRPDAQVKSTPPPPPPSATPTRPIQQTFITPKGSDGTEVLNTLPTREECHALRRSRSPTPSESSASASTNSSKSSIDERAEERHREVLKAVEDLRDSVKVLSDQLVNQVRSSEQIAQCIKTLTTSLTDQQRLMAFNPQYPPPPRYLQPVAPPSQYQPSIVPTNYLPATQQAVSTSINDSQTRQSNRDRSPIRFNRRDRSRERRRTGRSKENYRPVDRRVVNTRH